MSVSPLGLRPSPLLKPKPKIAASTRRRLKLRKEFWPDVTEDMIWVRANFTGFTSIPRTMPLIIKIINDLDRKNAGSVYFDLWARAFDDFMIEIKDEYECAFSSGYEGQRAIRSWRERMEVLESLEFIRCRKTSHGSYRYAVILEPHRIIQNIYESGRVSEDSRLALETHLISIGANRQ